MDQDVQIPSTSKASMETQPDVPMPASTTVSTFAEPHTISVAESNAKKQIEYSIAKANAKKQIEYSIAAGLRKTNAEYQRDYRRRKAAERATQKRSRVRKTNAQYQREYRQRKAAKLALASGMSELTTNAQQQHEYKERISTNRALTNKKSHSTAASTEITEQQTRQHEYRQRISTNRALTNKKSHSTAASTETTEQQTRFVWSTKWSSSINRFKRTFTNNDFGQCSVCDRLWFKNDLTDINALQRQIISEWFVKESLELNIEEYKLVCNTCKLSLNRGSMPKLAKVNRLSYPKIPPGLPPLDPVSERSISPRPPFMQAEDFCNKVKHDLVGCRLAVKAGVVPSGFGCEPDSTSTAEQECKAVVQSVLEAEVSKEKEQRQLVVKILEEAGEDTPQETSLTDELILKNEPETFTDECMEGESILPDDAEGGGSEEAPWTPPPLVIEPLCVWDTGADTAELVPLPQPLPGPAPATPDAVARELQLLQAARVRTEELNQQLRASLRALRNKEALLNKELKAVEKQRRSLRALALVPAPSPPLPALAPLSDIKQEPNLAPLPDVAPLQNLTSLPVVASVPALAPLSHQAPAPRPPVPRRCAPRILTRRPFVAELPPKKPDWPRELVAEWCRLQQARTQAEKVVQGLSEKKAKALEAEKRIEARVEDVRVQRNLVETEIGQMEREKAYLNKALGRLTPAWNTRSRMRSTGTSSIQKTVGPGAGSSPNSTDDCLGDFELVFWKKDGVELSCADLLEPTDPVAASSDLKRPRDHSSSSNSSVDGASNAQSSLGDEKPCKEPKLAEATQDSGDADALSCSGLCCECGDLLPSGVLLETHIRMKHPEMANRAPVPVKEEPTTTRMNPGTTATWADNDKNLKRSASLRPATFCCRHCKVSFATCHERDLHQESCTSVAEPMFAQEAVPVDPLDGT